jgi:nitrous oxide reductase accessory protein NosL
LLAAGSSWGAAAATEPKTVSCSECGMTAAVAGRFTSRLIINGSTLYFCDLGDLVTYLGRTQPQEYAAAVRDFPSGEWLDATEASFVIDKKTYATPMGWGVAAFRKAPAGGTALDFEAVRKALR